jgi:hypothetical protein
MNSPLVRRLYRWAGAAVLLLVLGSMAHFTASLPRFTAARNGRVVRLEWEMSSETGITGFELARKAAPETSFTPVGHLNATGQRHYRYLDAAISQPNSGSPAPGGPAARPGPVTYRLSVRGAGGERSYVTVLAAAPSAVQRSWSTIKTMFR